MTKNRKCEPNINVVDFCDYVAKQKQPKADCRRYKEETDRLQVGPIWREKRKEKLVRVRERNGAV
jgi:hypothetical protein